jgi:hypothetical protein
MLAWWTAAGSLCAGPFVESGVLPGEVARWASQVVDGSYLPALGVGPPFDQPTSALFARDAQVVSLGDLNQAAIDAGAQPGTITVQFDRPLRNGPGWDVAVFENGFTFEAAGKTWLFAELAYVEFSSNGDDFVRMPATSLTTARDAEFDLGIDPTDIRNLAGKHAAGEGTGFDLEELVGHSLVTQGRVDLQAIRWVRLVDIAGSASVATPLMTPGGTPAFVDSAGNVILDAWDTAVDFPGFPAVSAGFDLDAVGARYAVPEPTTCWLLGITWVLVLGKRRPPLMLDRSRDGSPDEAS